MTSAHPQWTDETVGDVADRYYREMAPVMNSPGELLLAQTVSALMASHAQHREALVANSDALRQAGDGFHEAVEKLIELQASHRTQVAALSKRLEALEARRS